MHLPWSGSEDECCTHGRQIYDLHHATRYHPSRISIIQLEARPDTFPESLMVKLLPTLRQANHFAAFDHSFVGRLPLIQRCGYRKTFLLEYRILEYPRFILSLRRNFENLLGK